MNSAWSAMIEKVEKNAWMFELAPAIAPTMMVIVPSVKAPGHRAVDHEAVRAVVTQRAQHGQQRAEEQLLLRQAQILFVQRV